MPEGRLCEEIQERHQVKVEMDASTVQEEQKQPSSIISQGKSIEQNLHYYRLSEDVNSANTQISDISKHHQGTSLVAQMVKKISVQCRRLKQDPQSGRSPGEWNGNPLQYSCLENSMDRETWWVIVHGVTESDKTEQVTHTAPRTQIFRLQKCDTIHFCYLSHQFVVLGYGNAWQVIQLLKMLYPSYYNISVPYISTLILTLHILLLVFLYYSKQLTLSTLIVIMFFLNQNLGITQANLLVPFTGVQQAL